MKKKIKALAGSIDKAFADIKDLRELENLRIQMVGKKGELSALFAELKELSEEVKKDVAKELNALKTHFESTFEKTKKDLSAQEVAKNLKQQYVDASLFTTLKATSNGHPINQVMDKIIEYFVNMNFSLQTGPLVEDDFHNFEALNIPKYHPARDMQDTFYFKDSLLLRTHTSPVQIRTMQNAKLPIRIIAPGAVFRRDNDVTHSPMFHQIEGLVVDSKDKVSFANLKYILEDFLRYMFGDVRVRFRSSFFPFTEPSAEVDISCVFCNGVDENGKGGCRVCSHTGWLEVLGCGVVDSNVFKAVEYKNVSGYAFGLGIERFAMLLSRVNDLRSFFESDLRVLEQF